MSGRSDHAAKERRYPREQLVLLDGLDHVVVGTAAKPHDNVFFAAAAGGEHDGQRVAEIRADSEHDIQTRQVGHFPIKDQYVEIMRTGQSASQGSAGDEY